MFSTSHVNHHGCRRSFESITELSHLFFIVDCYAFVLKTVLTVITHASYRLSRV